MKIFLTLWAALCLLLILTYTGCIKKYETPLPYKVDVPEEWQAITTDSLKPDTLLVYRTKDSLYLQFP